MKRIINTLIAACLLPAAGMAATTVTLNPVADAYVQGGNKAGVNYGSATELRAQTHNSPSNNYKSYLKFDTSAIAEQVRSSAFPGSFSAKLRVYAALSGSGNIWPHAYGVSDTTWSESAITWNNKPAFGSSLGVVNIASSTSYAWQEIDVSYYVKNEISAGRNVISLGLDDNELASSVYVNANSREAANPPQLVIAFNAQPVVTITSPAEGSVYTAPASVTLTADAVDSDGSMAYVTFVVWDGSGEVSRQTVTAPPFTHTLSNLPAGSYSVSTKASDNDGAEAWVTSVSFTVNPANVPPSVSLTSPTDGSSYTAPASITLTADAADSDGSIAAVEFYDGATLIASLTTPPYSYTWNDVPAGSHSLTAKATDNQGAVTTSTPASINVNAATASGVYYIYTDHLNTPRIITDASNKVVWRWDSDPFGAEKANEDPDGDGAKFTYNLRFPGQYYDRETNLHYNYFRDYDPTTGRYVQSDPIGLEGGINTYAYVGGNPTRLTDPLGLVPFGPVIGGGLGGGLTLSAGGAIGNGVSNPTSTRGSSFVSGSRDRNSCEKKCDDSTLQDIARRRKQWCKFPNQPQACLLTDGSNELFRKRYHFDQCIRARDEENMCKGVDPGHQQAVDDLSVGRDLCDMLILRNARNGVVR